VIHAAAIVNTETVYVYQKKQKYKTERLLENKIAKTNNQQENEISVFAEMGKTG